MPAQFVLRRLVQFSETDLAGIVHFSNYYKYMEEAEHAFFRSLGLSIMRTEADGTVTGWPRVRSSCSYESPAFYQDEIDIGVTVVRKGVKSLTMEFQFWRGETRIALGELKTVCCACKHGGEFRSIPIPDDYADKLVEAPPAS